MYVNSSPLRQGILLPGPRVSALPHEAFFPGHTGFVRGDVVVNAYAKGFYPSFCVRAGTRTVKYVYIKLHWTYL